MSNKEIKQQMSEYLKSHNILTLATVCANGKPVAHTVTYVSEGTTVYLGTYKGTRKAKNIIKNPSVAYTVDEDYPDWSKIKGIQMKGTAELLTDQAEMQSVWGKMLEKFPAARDIPQNPDMVIIKITPKSGYFLDYTKGFTHRDEVNF